ncbi:hypothetical protein [Paenibacillus thiaminolyticus]|uniref:hypothetical protein n=1 Tax=Paenibacillus thiaminolyticus TaxID=49283 RepID=UPI0025430904|nr:hypothetical protein [Paenibacillus thiaminolyticus]WII38217.1 hypothetical protein O0V01_03475 [Paenibacillus thiaminolyticus]
MEPAQVSAIPAVETARYQRWNQRDTNSGISAIPTVEPVRYQQWNQRVTGGGGGLKR